MTAHAVRARTVAPSRCGGGTSEVRGAGEAEAPPSLIYDGYDLRRRAHARDCGIEREIYKLRKTQMRFVHIAVSCTLQIAVCDISASLPGGETQSQRCKIAIRMSSFQSEVVFLPKKVVYCGSSHSQGEPGGWGGVPPVGSAGFSDFNLRYAFTCSSHTLSSICIRITCIHYMVSRALATTVGAPGASPSKHGAVYTPSSARVAGVIG